MTPSQELFLWAAEALQERTTMSLPQCRGTLRLALKQAGLQPDELTLKGLQVVLSRIMPRELRVRGFRNAESLCRDLLAQLEAADLEAPEEPSPSTADSVMDRIFGSS